MNYEKAGNRYTAIFIEQEDGTLVRFSYDQVRFNVDEDPDAVRELVPISADSGKIFEKVWITKTTPWVNKVGSDGLS